MHFGDAKGNASERYGEERLGAPIHPGSAVLRRAFRRNIVSFPAQVPVFLKQPTGDAQWRMVLLYFVRGWSAPKIARRFNVPIHRIRKILNAWSVRALERGLIQVIDPEAFAVCCGENTVSETNRDTEVIQEAQVGPVLQSVPRPHPGEAAMVGDALPSTLDGVRLESGPADSRVPSPDLVAALDVAIAQCEEWRGEFWAHMATLLRNMRTAAAVAHAIRLSSEPATTSSFPSGHGGVHQGLGKRGEERISHAVV